MLLLFAVGCTTRLTDFTVLSTKNVDLSRMDTYERQSTRVTGEDKKHIIIFIPTGVPNAKEAIDRAIESVPGGVGLVDGVIEHKAWYIPYIYGQTSYVAEGTVLVDPALR
ncbi:MAG: hypothetical protein JXA90_16940 [Planctomycetes bacterium]|nr:hypothetical protein [Planctomycetota bacterium]